VWMTLLGSTESCTSHQALGGSIHNLAQANSADPRPILLSGNNNSIAEVYPVG